MASSEPWGRGISWADVRRSFEIGYFKDVARGDGIDGLIGVGGLEPCTRFLRKRPKGGRGRGRNRRPGREPDQPFRRSHRTQDVLGRLLDAKAAIMRACWVTMARIPEASLQETDSRGKMALSSTEETFRDPPTSDELDEQGSESWGPKRSWADRAPTPE
jgi:hypothetical protein